VGITGLGVALLSAGDLARGEGDLTSSNGLLSLLSLGKLDNGIGTSEGGHSNNGAKLGKGDLQLLVLVVSNSLEKDRSLVVFRQHGGRGALLSPGGPLSRLTSVLLWLLVAVLGGLGAGNSGSGSGRGGGGWGRRATNSVSPGGGLGLRGSGGSGSSSSSSSNSSSGGRGLSNGGRLGLGGLGLLLGTLLVGGLLGSGSGSSHSGGGSLLGNHGDDLRGHMGHWGSNWDGGGSRGLVVVDLVLGLNVDGGGSGNNGSSRGSVVVVVLLNGGGGRDRGMLEGGGGSVGSVGSAVILEEAEDVIEDIVAASLLGHEEEGLGEAPLRAIVVGEGAEDLDDHTIASGGLGVKLGDNNLAVVEVESSDLPVDVLQVRDVSVSLEVCVCVCVCVCV